MKRSVHINSAIISAAIDLEQSPYIYYSTYASNTARFRRCELFRLKHKRSGFMLKYSQDEFVISKIISIDKLCSSSCCTSYQKRGVPRIETHTFSTLGNQDLQEEPTRHLQGPQTGAHFTLTTVSFLLILFPQFYNQSTESCIIVSTLTIAYGHEDSLVDFLT